MKPIVLGMIISDHYYRDASTGKSIITGTFNSINSSIFPTNHGNCAVYISLTDIALSGKVELIFRQESGPFTITLPSWEIEAPENRRAVVEIGGNIAGLPIPEEGNYEFVVLWNGKEIFSRRLLANKVELIQK